MNLIVCGFLGSGKTTLIRRIVSEALCGCRVVVVENESGQESVDGLFLRDGGLQVVDLRGGCVCCTLRSQMAEAMARIRDEFRPDCVLLEPSGLGDLVDLLRIPGFEPDGVVMLVDVERYDLLLRMNRDRALRQFRLAPVLMLTRTDRAERSLTARVRRELEQINPRALIVESRESFDAVWWLETLPERCARFRAFSPELPDDGPHFRAETFAVGREVGPGELTALFQRTGCGEGAPVRAKGVLRSERGWMKVDWLAPGEEHWTPLAGRPDTEGFLICWWPSPGMDATNEMRNSLNEWIYGTR